MSYNIILASNSPRRRELLAGLGLNFTVRVKPDVSEGYPQGLSPKEIAIYIANEKAEANVAGASDNELVITADTIVVVGDTILGKPKDDADAKRMLRLLSGTTHQVITGVAISTNKKRRTFATVTDVTFRPLNDEEIDYYVSMQHPLDKAGAYGIQEWIGYVGVANISGSYYNVMGLPVQRLYSELQHFIPKVQEEVSIHRS